MINHNHQTLVVIGGGFAGHNLLFHLAQQLYQDSLQNHSFPQSSLIGPWKLILIDSPSLAPSCSYYSASLCALRGAKEETPRGEKLYRGFQAMKEFVETYQPQGVFQGDLSSLCLPHHPHEEDYRRRFGEMVEERTHLPFLPTQALPSTVLNVTEEAYFFDAALYFTWVKNYIRSLSPATLSLEERHSFVNQVEITHSGIILTTEENEQLKSDHVFLATGGFTKIFKDLYPQKIEISDSKLQSGYYLEFDLSHCDWIKYYGEKPWAVNLFEKRILVYRPHSQKLLMTGAEAEGATFSPPYPQLHQSYHMFTEVLGEKIPLPPFASAKIYMGLRQKGVKRQPFWGEITPTGLPGGLYGLFSMYKNGLSYSFLGSKELTKTFMSQLKN